MRIPFIKQKHRKYLEELSWVKQDAKDYQMLYSPKEYRLALLEHIKAAKQRIYIIALYLERDEAGDEILRALYAAKQQNPTLDVKVLIDWHRAQRGRIGEGKAQTNAQFYYDMKNEYLDIELPIFGVPVNRRELLGVLHLKGSVIDDAILYTGSSINNVYLHKLDKYRYDRYHVIKNAVVADSMVDFTNHNLLNYPAIQRLDIAQHKTRKQLKSEIRALRSHLCQSSYSLTPPITKHDGLAILPVVGLGKNNQLNQMIHHLISATQSKVTFCTPYFNLPHIIIKDIIRVLRKGKNVEIIVGDKTANDFFIPENEPFNIVGGLPYLYEINLRKFVERLQHFVDNGQLNVRLWKDQAHSYHLKGIWVDDEWMLITGNNLNPRAWRLDLENGILVKDPNGELQPQIQQELQTIRANTLLINHFQQIQASQFYPKNIHKLIKNLSRIRIDRIIKRLL